MGDEIKTVETTVKAKAIAFFVAHRATVIAFVVGVIVGVVI